MAVLAIDLKVLRKMVKISVHDLGQAFGVSASRIDTIIKKDYINTDFSYRLLGVFHVCLGNLREKELLNREKELLNNDNPKSEELKKLEASLKKVSNKLNDLLLETEKLRSEQDAIDQKIDVIKNGGPYELESGSKFTFDGSGSGFSRKYRVPQGFFKLNIDMLVTPPSFELFLEYKSRYSSDNEEYMRFEKMDLGLPYQTVPSNEDLVFYVFATEDYDWKITLESLSEEKEKEAHRLEFSKKGEIRELALSEITQNYLQAANIISVQKLLSYTRSDLVNEMVKVGSSAVDVAIMKDIEDALNTHDLSFKVPKTEAFHLESSKLYTAIEELDLSVVTYNCLRRSGISTLYDLVSKSTDEIKKIRNLGRKSLNEILVKLEDQGITFTDG
jgi:hypothetical protein